MPASYPPILMPTDRRLADTIRGWDRSKRAAYIAQLSMHQRLELARVLKGDLRERARRDIIAFAQAMKEDYKPAPFHRTIGTIVNDMLDRKLRRVIVTLPAQHGKCWGLNELITTEDGGEVRVQDVVAGMRVRSLDPATFKQCLSTVVASCSNGDKACLRLRLFSGRELTRTTNHPLLTPTGWREVGELRPGDFVAVARGVSHGNKELPWGFAALMGYLTGDRSFTKGHPMVTTIDPDTVDHLVRIATHHGWEVHQDGSTYHVRKPTRHGDRARSPNRVLASYMSPGSSHTKRVPQSIFTACHKDVAEYLGAYFVCDGHVWKQRAGGLVYYSVNRHLLLDVQRLLLRFSISASLREKRTVYKGEPYLSYQLIIAGVDDVRRFRDQIVVVGSKAEQIDSVLSRPRLQRASQSASEAIPTGWHEHLQHTTSWFRFKHGLRIDACVDRTQVRTSRVLVRRAAELEGNEKLLWMTDNGVCWDMITDIQEMGTIPTWSLEVTDHHVVLSGDIVDHNSELISRNTPPAAFGRDPDERIIATSYGASLTSEMSKAVQNIMDSSEYGVIFPGVGLAGSRNAPQVPGKWRRNDEVFDIVGRRGYYVSAGIGGAINGKSATLGIIDDYFKSWEEARSETMRLKLWNWYKSVFFTRLQKDAVIAILCCMTGDTRVTMSDGTWKRLDQVRPGDVVWAWKDGKAVRRRVTDWIPQGPDDVFEIRTGNHTVRANARHPFLTTNGWKKVKELIPGDRLVGNRFLTPEANATINTREAWLLGYMIGDGWITKRDTTQRSSTGKMSPRRGYVTCAAKKVREEVNETFLSAMQDLFGVMPKLTSGGYWRTEVQRVGRWMVAHGVTSGAKSKRVPISIFSEPQDIRIAFLEGFRASDGHQAILGGPPRHAMSSSSQDLIADLRHLARSCGYQVTNIYSSSRMTQPPNSPVPVLNEAWSFEYNLHSRTDDEFDQYTIRSIKPVGREEVYDLTVDDAECFFADGLVSHNTRWHKEDLVGLIVEQARRHVSNIPWTVIELPAIMDREPSWYDQRALGDLLWPDWFPLERYQEMPAYQDPDIWAAIYQCRPTTQGGGIWKEAWWRYWCPRGMGAALPPIEVAQPDGTFKQAIVRELPDLDSVTISADLTFGNTGTSAVSMGVWGASGADSFRLDELNGRMTFTEAKDGLRLLVRSYPEAAAKLVEKKANGEATIDALATGIKSPTGDWIEEPIPGMIPIMPTKSKIERANDVTPFLRGGNVYLPHPALLSDPSGMGLRVSGSAAWVPAFKGEASDFPTGARNDRVDETSQYLAYRYLDKQAKEDDAVAAYWRALEGKK